ncbi:choice-of-anchor P family protein [Actinophytocola sp.]|uniref:choice-of-anchor P family protein n=1 Tax=Actinophytocola sp. TaxID=1872138 RepID=UPI002ED8EBA4
MTMRYARRTGVVGLAVAGVCVAVCLAGLAPAQAADWESIAGGSLGAVDLVLDGDPAEIAPIAECGTDGVEDATSSGAEVAGFVQFSGGTSTCTVDQATGVATASVTGARFRLDGLRQYGGPRTIRMTSFTATCHTTETGSSASFQFRGLTGLTVPSSIPPNHVITIPGAAGAPPVATVTLNETIVPSPPDGSMTVNLMHFHLFPQGPADKASGDIVVGSVNCAPF